MRRSASLSEVAIGFSERTFTLCFAAVMPCSGCRPEGVQSTIRSRGFSLSMAS